MKSLLCFSLLMCFAATATHSKESTDTKKLAVQTVTAEPAHLTTRIQWVKFPQVQYDDGDLNHRDRFAIVRVKADESGKVTSASVQESTGIKKLDQILLKAVYSAKTKPFKKDGNHLSMIGYQAFSLKLNDGAEDNSQCEILGISKNWAKQQKDKSAAFEYLKQPDITIEKDILKNQNRVIKFKFKVNKHGDVKKVELKKHSGVNAIDQQVIEAVSNSKVLTHRTASTLWMYKKSRLSDEISFKIENCQ